MNGEVAAGGAEPARAPRKRSVEFAVLRVDEAARITSVEGDPTLLPGSPVGQLVADVFGEAGQSGITKALSGSRHRATVAIAGAWLDLRFQPVSNSRGALILALRAPSGFAHDRPDRRFRVLFNQLPGATWATDRQLRFTYAFGRAPALSARSARDWIGQRLQDFVGTEDPSNPAIAHHLAALAGESTSFRYDVGDHTYEIRIEPLRDSSHRIVGCSGVAIDVTERRKVEDRLAESEGRLSKAQNLAHVGSWEWDILRDTVWWSDELYRIYGLKAEERKPTLEGFLERVHPDDLEETRRVLFEAMRKPGPFAYDHRIVRSDGQVRRLRTTGAAIADQDGRATHMLGTCWDITEWWETTRQFERSVSLLNATLESTADGILVVDRSSKITKYNQSFLSLWRIGPELAARADDDTLLAAVVAQLEDPESFVRRVQDLYAHPEAESFDVLHFNDGRVFERYSKPQRLDGKVIGRVWSFRDVTDRERLLRRAIFLADAARLLASLDVERALEGVARLAVPFLGDGCAVDLLADLGGPRRLLAVSRDAAQPLHVELPRAVLAGRPLIFRGGETSYMSLPLVAHGQMLGALTFMAAEHRRYTQDDLDFGEEIARRAALAIENARLYRKAEEALRAREEFLAIAAHEIRGPLTSIHLATQGLERAHLSGAAASHLFEIIQREVRRLTSFVNELLDVGRIRAGRLHFELSQVNLEEVARDSVSHFTSELAASGSTLSMTSPGAIAGLWDRSRLEQVSDNLLSNAIKFGLGKPIDVEVRASENRAALVVRDHGIGIPEEEISGIFEPFKRAVSARHYGGLGLGLYIVRTIVEGLGGTVQVASELGQGTTFTVELPRSRAS